MRESLPDGADAVVVGAVDWHGSIAVAHDMQCVTSTHVFDVMSDCRKHQSWRVTDTRSVYTTDEIEGALAWSGDADAVMTLKPFRYTKTHANKNSHNMKHEHMSGYRLRSCHV